MFMAVQRHHLAQQAKSTYISPEAREVILTSEITFAPTSFVSKMRTAPAL